MLYTFETLTWFYSNDDVTFEVKSRELGLTLPEALDRMKEWAVAHPECAPDAACCDTIIELDDDIRDDRQEASRIQYMDSDKEDS